jgi:hypothetical protein
MLVTMPLHHFLTVLAIATGLGFAGGGVAGALVSPGFQVHYTR